MTRMRTLPKALDECRAKDPETCITLGALRKWVKCGDLPSTKSGKNFLINMDDLERFLSGSAADR